MMYSAIGGLATAVPMVLALRRGAPTSPARAGWLTGIAAGGLGAFAYNLHCPFNNVIYIGLWYTLAVGGLCGDWPVGGAEVDQVVTSSLSHWERIVKP